MGKLADGMKGITPYQRSRLREEMVNRNKRLQEISEGARGVLTISRNTLNPEQTKQYGDEVTSKMDKHLAQMKAIRRWAKKNTLPQDYRGK